MTYNTTFDWRKKVTAYYKNQYSQYGHSAQRHYPNEELCRFIGSKFGGISHQERFELSVLEVGCGERQCEEYFAQRGFHYVGVDIENHGIGPNVLGDAHNLPFADASFDLCYSCACFEHLQCALLGASEVFRILKPGGTFSGTVAFLEGFHDRASFFHMSHAGVYVMLTSVGFHTIRLWPGWHATRSVPAALFSGRSRFGAPIAMVFNLLLRLSYYGHFATANLLRRLAGRPSRSLQTEDMCTAGSVNFCCTKKEAPSCERAMDIDERAGKATLQTT